MVRTLVFHTNNVGSIPTSLSITSPWQFESTQQLLIKKMDQRSAIRYSFRFVSLVSPSTSSTEPSSAVSPYSPLPKRLLVKRSYLILSWLYYMTTSDASLRNRKRPRIAILPPTKSMYTLTKAPMAHKTNSKEQFLFKFYNFKFSFNLKTNVKLAPATVAQGAHSVSITKKLFPVFETNMLFLKNYEISYPVHDKNFFGKILS